VAGVLVVCGFPLGQARWSVSRGRGQSCPFQIGHGTHAIGLRWLTADERGLLSHVFMGLSIVVVAGAWSGWATGQGGCEDPFGSFAISAGQRHITHETQVSSAHPGTIWRRSCRATPGASLPCAYHRCSYTRSINCRSEHLMVLYPQAMESISRTSQLKALIVT
jgi:hypothetical protein